MAGIGALDFVPVSRACQSGRDIEVDLVEGLGVLVTQQGASLRGDVYRRGEDGYERVRLAPSRAVDWNARSVDRFPDLVVVAREDADVQAAVRYAREHGLKVKARSGGHSWADSSIRDGVLIDLSEMNGVASIRTPAPLWSGPGSKARS